MPAKIKDYEIHISDIQRFKRCRREWSWASHLKRNLEPREKYAPLWIGTLVHHGLEMRYRSQLMPEESIESFADANLSETQRNDPKVYENTVLAINLVDSYIKWQATDRTWLADRNFDFIAPEQDFKVLLWQTTRARIWLAGRFDGIVRRRDNGQLYLWEIKTTRSIAEREKQLDFDEQTSAYLYAARELGYDVQGVIYTLIRKKLPESPRILKNGLLSTDKSVDTTAEHYLACIKTQHSNAPLDRDTLLHYYGDILTHLGSQPNKFFKRCVVHRSQREIEHSAGEIIDVAREMLSPRTPIYMTATAGCNYCLFRSPCAAYNRGQDYEAILERDYQPNQKFVKGE